MMAFNKHMKQAFKLWMLLLPMAVGFAACSDNDDNDSSSAATDKAEYTIIYYAAGGSNVDKNILPMVEDFYSASAEAFQKVNVVVQYKFSTADNLKTEYDEEDHAPIADNFTEEFRQRFGSRAVRWIIDPAKTLISQIKEPANLYGKENPDCTCPDSLTNFIKWAVKTCPAKKYILVINDHGHGFIPHEDLPDVTSTRGVVFDDGYIQPDGSKKHFTIKNLTRAIRSSRVRFETIYMLACMMNNFAYQFEMKSLCNYTIAATYTMPASGGALNVLVEQFAQPSVNVEQALTAYCKADVESWDKAWGITEETPLYTDLTVTRTSALNNLGVMMREFIDRLCDVYQNGTDDQKAKIDKCTDEAIKVNMTYPFYDGGKYMISIMKALPEVYEDAFCMKFEDVFNKAIVSQYRSKYLEAHDYQVDYSLILGVDGSYSMLTWDNNDERWLLKSRKRYCADGKTYVSNYAEPVGEDKIFNEMQALPSDPWGSTLAETFGQTEFDKAVGWSRWLKLNRKEPSLFCPEGMNFVLPDGDVSDDPNL